MSQVQDVKAANDIVTVLGERLSLQRAGSNWRALCPFHSERSPSFFINEQFQRYKCFGCGESGDVFTFLEKYEGMTFGEALEHLADKAGIVLEKKQFSQEDDQRKRLLEILNLAKEYYHFLLTSHKAGEPAKKYLKERGATAESVKVFELGYAPEGWDNLVQYLHGKKKYSLEDLLAAGLVVKSTKNPGSNKVYDRFRGRLMFPLKNHRGQVVGFSGRLLSADAKEAKYINSPETQLYHKSKMLFGFSELYQEIRKKKEVIVVEGEFDVISSAQAHVNNIVAIKGSALTVDHLKLLERVAQRIYLCLDTDAAGVEATKRAITISLDSPAEVRVITIPEGKDPDELARQAPSAWRDATKKSMTPYDFLIDSALKTHDTTTPEGKRRILQELAPWLSQVPMAVEQQVYIKRLAAALNVKEELVKQDITKLAKKQTSTLSSLGEKPAQMPTNQVVAQSKLDTLAAHSLFLISMMSFTEGVKAIAEMLSLELPQPWHSILKQLNKTQATLADGLTTMSPVMEQLDEDSKQLVFDASTKEEMSGAADVVSTNLNDPQDIGAKWQWLSKELKTESIKARLLLLTTKIAALDAQPNASETEYTSLLSQVADLQKELKKS